MRSEQESGSITPRKEWFTLQSPIGVIGRFAAIVQVAIILAAIFVDGPARWALIIFAAAAFFYVFARTGLGGWSQDAR